MDTKDIDIRVRAQMEGRKVLAETAKDIEDIEAALKKQRAATDKGEAGIVELEAGYKKLENTLRGVAAAFDLSRRFETQNAALAKTAQRLDVARQKQEAFDASLVKGAELTEKQVREQIRLAAAVDRAAAAMAAAQTRVDTTAGKLRAYGIDTAKIGDAQSRMAAMILNGNTALKQQEEAIDKAGAAQKRMAGNDVHAALERIRSTVLGLAAAYVGVQQAAGLAGGSIEAFSSREGVKNQLALSVGNDKAAIDAEYEYVRAQADRIGIEFDRASKGYAKFAAAAKLAGRDRQEIRYIWEAFAEVGRVANLSADDMDGMFKALEQITSKGKIQAEELRGQLGDRLFGAFQIAAKALKDQFPDLDKAMKDGLVTSDQLVAIAQKYRETVADQLPEAIRSTSAEQARYTNAVQDFKRAIADAGWADAFTNALKNITAALQSEDGKKFAESLAAGFSAAADAAVWLLKNSDEVLIVLKALAGLWAINAAGKAVSGVLDYSAALRTLIADGKLTIAHLGLMRGAFALLQAALVGWSIGTWANEEFEVVRKAGIALVTGLDESWTRIKYGAQIVWEEIPRYAKNAFAAMLNTMTWGTRQMLEVMQKGFQAIGRDDLAAKVGTVLDKLTAKYEEQSSRVADIRGQMEKDLNAIRDIGFEMWKDAERRPAAAASAPSTAGAPTARPTIKQGKSTAGPTDAEIAKREREIEAIQHSLETLDAKVDRTQTDTLSKQLEAVDLEYAKLARRIGAVGGEAGAEFMVHLQASTAQLKTQITAKFNQKLLDEQEALQNKLEDIEAAAGKRSKFNLDARLAGIEKQYADTYRRIAEYRAELKSNGRDTAPADLMKGRLAAGVAELQNIERIKYATEELNRLEQQVNDTLTLRKDRIAAVRAQEEAGLIDDTQAADQINQINQQAVPAIQAAALAARDWAMSHAAVFANPEQMDLFIAKMNAISAGANKAQTEFANWQKYANGRGAAAINSSLDSIFDGLMDIATGQKSVKQGFRDIAASTLGIFAQFFKDIALAILKMMIFNALKNSGNPYLAAVGNAGAQSVSVKHSGGVVGHVSNRNRAVSPFVFQNAPRYHSGGIAGLAPDEYATILKKNEEVLTADSPRNILNGGGGAGKGDGGRPQDVSITNYVDAQSFLSAAAATPAGRKVIVNVLSAERAQIRTLLGVR
ncbi:MAG TPA: tape measure protein [Aromatoleum sp.]|uniref:tape measure protein n=1 Tax=Aromatoleum sp. TaxID=2307007 RepID=UPI002B460E7B|nr:tape measure protein [Aromatoleum sp.]HJV26858.1 tape measure protein [Aromatoleum sp.]